MKGRNGAQSIPMTNKKDKVDKNGSNNQDGEDCSIFSSEALATEKENKELISLREQVEDLQKKLLEKDELLKSAELSKNQINDVRAELGKLKRDVAEKGSLIKSIQLQLSDAKILMRFEQDQKETEDACRFAEQNAAAQRYSVEVLQEKYEKAIVALAEMEKRAIMAESMVEATLHYHSGQNKAQPSLSSRY